MVEKDLFLEMMRLLYLARSFDEKAKVLCAERVIGGVMHFGIGQEATDIGSVLALEKDDFLGNIHRGHGHEIAKGADMRFLMAELMGRKTGYSKGFGGDIHIFSQELGLLGRNGIIGANIPIATGAAFTAKYRGTKQVALVFFGDGAVNQGVFHETLNIGAIWKLPIVYVCVNNLYAASTPAVITQSTQDIVDKALAYNMPGKIVDGQDVVAVYDGVSEAVSRARAGDGPTLIESKTYRFESHCGFSGRHNNPEELKVWKQRDPIVLHERRLLKEKLVTPDELETMKKDATAQVEEAAAFAKESPFPGMEDWEVTPGLRTEI